MNIPLVSIIVTTFNSKKWLREALDSTLAQTYSNLEIILIDDGSTDDTGNWVRKHYPNNINYIYKQNGGLASARNLGITKAKGQYIQFLDADDIILPEKISSQICWMETHLDYAVVYSDSICFYDGSPHETFDWWGKTLYRSGNVFESMIDNGYILSHATLTRSTYFKNIKFNENLKSAVDWDFWLNLSKSEARFYYLPGDPTCLYRIRKDSMSSDKIGHTLSGIQVLTNISKELSNSKKEQKQIVSALGRWKFSHGRALIQDRQLIRGWILLLKSLVKDHRNLKYKLTYIFLVPIIGHALTIQLQAKGKMFLGKLLVI